MTGLQSTRVLIAGAAFAALAWPAAAQTPPPARTPTPASPAAQAKAADSAAPITVSSDYVIGIDDHLLVSYWNAKDMSGEFVVLPDGKISLPLINSVQAAGLTLEQLRAEIVKAVTTGKYMQDPTVSIAVTTINSRKVSIQGEVKTPGLYPLSGPMTIMTLLAEAGGLQEFADSKKIFVQRMENGKPVTYDFNYQDYIKKKNLKQNIELKPGDIVVVP